MGIREESKNEYRNRILAAAQLLFESQGFEDTTIEQIAHQAGIGLGTAYNYFHSKEELFVLAMAEGAVDSDPRLETNWSGSAADIVCSAIFSQIKRMNWTNKKIWRIAFPIILNSMKSGSHAFREVMRADFKLIEQTKLLIRQMKERGLIGSDFDEETANDLIFGAVFYQTSLFIYSDDLTFEEVLDRIRNNIEFIFKNDGRHPL